MLLIRTSCGLISYWDHPLIFEKNIKTVGIVVALLGPKQTAYEERDLTVNFFNTFGWSEEMEGCGEQ